MPASEPDIALVRRFQKGDESAFTQLIERHQDRVFRLASVWLHDRQLAADAAQEAFLRAFTSLQGFLFRASVSTYLFRMTKNVCQEFNRERGRHIGVEIDGPAPQSPAADVGHDLDQTIDEVRRAIAQLPPRQRDVVLLRQFEELSVNDTAKVIGCRPGTVKAHLSKAMANLRKQVDTQLTDAQFREPTT